MPKKLDRENVAPRVTLSLRTTPEVREWLERHAVKSGRALAVEAEARLEQMYDTEKGRGAHTAALVDMIALVIRSAEAQSGFSWLDGEAEATAIFQRVSMALAAFMGAVERPENLVIETDSHPNPLFRALGQTRSPESVGRVQAYSDISRQAEGEALDRLDITSVAKWRADLAAEAKPE